MKHPGWAEQLHLDIEEKKEKNELKGKGLRQQKS
jgi:hypothetical protein